MDYLTINEHRTTALGNETSPYDEGYADGTEGNSYHPTLSRLDPDYRQGYVKGLVASMREIAARQRDYLDPSTGFDWF